MFEDDYQNDPNFYFTLAGACSVCVCCLVCTAKNWDDPPDWLPNFCQPRWKRDYYYDEHEIHSKITTRANYGRQHTMTLSDSEALV
tara:strand:- start:260 stop:517 length:258 start_codon:yes stop_codon:yes gene_type:complete